MFLKNCWYVVAWSSEVPDHGFLTRTVINMPLVLWRDSAGKVIAFEDRCCHRGAPLSMGRQEGDCITCMYHGLKFDSTGKCVEIPSQPRIPPQAKVRSYPLVERYKWIWVWMGDTDKADPSLIPDTHWLDDPEWASQDGGYLQYDVNYLLIADNLLDFSHLPYVHPTTLGGSEDYAKSSAKVEHSERAVKVTRWVLSIDPPPFVQDVKQFDGEVDRWNIYDFVLPGILLMDSGMAPADTGAPDGIRENAAQFRSCQAITPETENSTHYFYAQPNDFVFDEEAVAGIHKIIAMAFEEDRAIITAQNRRLQLDPDFKMVPLSMDSALSRFRLLVNKFLAEEKEVESNK